MRLKPTEHQIHAAVAQWLRAQHPRLLFWHSHQSGRLSVAEAMKAKRMGRRAGIPDFTFLLPPHGTAGFIELKAEGGRQSEPQLTFEIQARAAGAHYAVCRSLEEVEGTLMSWGAIPGAGRVA